MSRKRTPTKKRVTLVDIIIPVHNRFDILKDCIEAIPAALGNVDYHIYVYDNGSERLDADAFYDPLDKANLSITRSGTNIGFPRACNTAFRKGRAPLVFFLNSDVVLRPGSVVKLAETMSDLKIGIAGMKLLFPTVDEIAQAGLDLAGRPAQSVQHIGLVSNIRGHVGHVFSGWSADNPKVNAVSTWDEETKRYKDPLAVTGAALMTRRKLFSQAGMFWDGYGMGTWEDVDFCMTAKEMGARVMVVPEAVGVHYTGATAMKYNIGFPMGRNYQLFLLRWREKLKQTDLDVL